MNLVLVGRADLDSLQSYAETNFSEVENRNLPVKDFRDCVVFDEKQKRQKVQKLFARRNDALNAL